MKKITAMLLTLTLLTGLMTVGAFADSGNGNGQPDRVEDSESPSPSPSALPETSSSATESPAVTTPVPIVTPPAADVNAAAEIALINRDAAKDLSVGNVEDNGDRIKMADLRAFKSSFSTLFTELNKQRVLAKTNWATLRSLNIQTRAAFDTFRNSLKSLPKAEKDLKMAAMKATLKPLHDLALPIHATIRTERTQKEQEWVKYRLAVKARDKVKAEEALKEIIRLKTDIVAQQTLLITIKQDMLKAIKAGVPTV